MYYQIQYGADGQSKRSGLTRKWIARIGLCLLGICVLVGVLWSANGDWAVTVGAMEEMADALKQGSNVTDAFTTFCLQILEGA